MARERRKNFRVEWQSPATIRRLDGHMICRCVLSDLSGGGAKITGVTVSAVPDQFVLRVDRGLKGMRKCRVLWRSAEGLGVAFTDTVAGPEEPAAGRAAKPTRRPVHA
ncbi:MAG: PilZ domain-containing protein [Hyphomicrobiales bacterium]